MTLTEDKDRPSFMAQQFIEGKVAWDKLSPATQSAVSFQIYKKAEAIIKHPGIDQRRLAFAETPEHLKDMVEKEVKRLWEIRKRRTL